MTSGGFDLSAFASGAFGAVLASTATFGTGMLSRREARRTAREARIAAFLALVSEFAIAVRRLPHPVTLLPDVESALYSRAFVAMGAIGFRRRDREVLRWTMDYLRKIAFEPSGLEHSEVSDAALIAGKLQEWSVGTTKRSWFKRFPAPGAEWDPPTPPAPRRPLMRRFRVRVRG